MPSKRDQLAKGFGAQLWDSYVDTWTERNRSGGFGEIHDWPGDEWSDPIFWENLYQQLFVPAGVKDWQRAVEIGPGSGKYTLKVLSGSSTCIRAYDVSERFLKVCESRCDEWIKQDRLSLHQLAGARANEMLADLDACNWRRTVDAFYSIDAMVHVDLQYLIVYLITAGLALKPGGKVILTLADVTTDLGFKFMLESIEWTYPAQGDPSGKFEWLSPGIVRSVLPRLGFEVELLGHTPRDLLVIASLANPTLVDELEQYIRPARHVQEVVDVVRAVLPPNATVLVVSSGDDALVELDGRRGWHFPQAEEGLYAGDDPVDSNEAIAHLEALRAQGADYLLFPATAIWWLDHYTEFHRYLRATSRSVLENERLAVFDLRR
jgi:hypothetical protein